MYLPSFAVFLLNTSTFKSLISGDSLKLNMFKSQIGVDIFFCEKQNSLRSV